MQHQTLAAAVSSVLALAVYLYRWAYHKRFVQHGRLPQHPPSLLWGHLRVFDDFKKQLKCPDAHPDLIFAEMRRALGNPSLMLMDLRPINAPMVIVGDHTVAEQLSRSSKQWQHSAPKAPTVSRVRHLVGQHSILDKQFGEWKDVRKRFSPGFAPAHVLTFLPQILRKTRIFLDILDGLASSGEIFSLDQVTQNLTFDIISSVTMDEDMEAQHLDTTKQSDLVRMFKELIKTYADDKFHLPWYVQPRVAWRRRQLGHGISELLRNIVRRRFEQVKADLDESRSHHRSVLALSLQDAEVLTPEVLEETCDQLKTFLFAGHDTTSLLIDWTLYEISRTPRVLEGIREELETLFGEGATADPAAIEARFLAAGGETLVYQMTYTSAVLKEVLRLHPPAGSIRTTLPGPGYSVSAPEGEFDLADTWIYINHTIIHRDPAVYSDTADDFVPERWLGADEHPISAWRPFERGPRNCIGMELAYTEARVILAMVACRYDFTKRGIGELDLNEDGKAVMNDKGQYKVKTELYPTIEIIAKPTDGMKMSVRMAASAH